MPVTSYSFPFLVLFSEWNGRGISADVPGSELSGDLAKSRNEDPSSVRIWVKGARRDGYRVMTGFGATSGLVSQAISTGMSAEGWIPGSCGIHCLDNGCDGSGPVPEMDDVMDIYKA